MDYFKFDIKADSETASMVLALLSQYPFDAFEETDHGLIAYIPDALLNARIEEAVTDITKKFGLPHTKSFIESKNWNAIWEADFQPVKIRDYCLIRASFHESEQGFNHEIIIDPKMAFGTGHHATTTLMVEMMRTLSFGGKRVLDFGAGTGILAILASKSGAAIVDANEIEAPAFENIKQNLVLNVIKNVTPVFGSLEAVEGAGYHIILANINRNTLLEYLPALYNRLSEGGRLLLSGFYEKDEFLMIKKAEQCAFAIGRRMEKDHWICLELLKPKA